mgnify:CR=1 FL=1
MDYDKFELGDVTLLSGEILSSAFLAFKTYGKLNAKKCNVVVLPTFYTGSHQRNEGFFGSGRAIDPDKHFIVSINMFGNGLSSSPSNTESRLHAGDSRTKILPKRLLPLCNWSADWSSRPHGQMSLG